jgi:hypothetical protein
MITAKEARVRAQNSQESVVQFLEVLGKKIEESVDKGLFSYTYTGGLSGDPTDHNKLSVEAYMRFEVPQFWGLVMAALSAYPNNFHVAIEKSEPYIPRGLMDDHDQGPEYVSYSMKITW